MRLTQLFVNRPTLVFVVLAMVALAGATAAVANSTQKQAVHRSLMQSPSHAFDQIG